MGTKKNRSLETAIFHLSEAKDIVDNKMKSSSVQDKAKLAAVQYYLKEAAFYIVNVINAKDNET